MRPNGIGELGLRQLRGGGAPISDEVRLGLEGGASLPPLLREVARHLVLDRRHDRELGSPPPGAPAKDHKIDKLLVALDTILVCEKHEGAVFVLEGTQEVATPARDKAGGLLGHRDHRAVLFHVLIIDGHSTNPLRHDTLGIPHGPPPLLARARKFQHELPSQEIDLALGDAHQLGLRLPTFSHDEGRIVLGDLQSLCVQVLLHWPFTLASRPRHLGRTHRPRTASADPTNLRLRDQSGTCLSQNGYG
mmetsp:Transcript_134825/g.430865  ORF Transcript_134825/g.430865 Transcript_134825/m.430865 type:complete len:248 (-) Transcript_134825:41-784(-)